MAVVMMISKWVQLLFCMKYGKSLKEIHLTHMHNEYCKFFDSRCMFVYFK